MNIIKPVLLFVYFKFFFLWFWVLTIFSMPKSLERHFKDSRRWGGWWYTGTDTRHVDTVNRTGGRDRDRERKRVRGGAKRANRTYTLFGNCTVRSATYVLSSEHLEVNWFSFKDVCWKYLRAAGIKDIWLAWSSCFRPPP